MSNYKEILKTENTAIRAFVGYVQVEFVVKPVHCSWLLFAGYVSPGPPRFCFVCNWVNISLLLKTSLVDLFYSPSRRVETISSHLQIDVATFQLAGINLMKANRFCFSKAKV